MTGNSPEGGAKVYRSSLLPFEGVANLPHVVEEEHSQLFAAAAPAGRGGACEPLSSSHHKLVLVPRTAQAGTVKQ